ncbi:MAG: GGDEF domain-containing protein [Gammaproteobacteria bacterium]|nr:GGDEF domain-containing protein [Gammaproteobacteria bacterium]
MDFSANHRRAPATLYEDQLRMGFGALRFTDFLEREFRESYAQENYQKSRLVLAMCAIVVMFVTVVQALSPSSEDNNLTNMGLVAMGLMIIGTLIMSYLDRRVLYHSFIVVSGLCIGIAGTIIDVQASLAGQGYYFAGQIGWTFIMWSMLGLLFAPAAALCFLVSIIYLGSATFMGLPGEQLFFEGFMLLNVNLLGGYSCYKIEYSSRRTFLESRILNQLAERDGLTGLYNRRAFDQHMERIWRQSRRENVPITVMFVDIDHFKAYNDMYGHQAGDDALKQVASVISSAVQRPLDIAARYGGEEFALLLYGPATDYVTSLPEMLREDVLALGTAHDGATATKLLTISIGVAIVSPDAERSQAGAIQMADEALYKAKEDGRNRVVVRYSTTTDVETGRFRKHA